jgi:hypothetical protein
MTLLFRLPLWLLSFFEAGSDVVPSAAPNAEDRSSLVDLVYLLQRDEREHPPS